MMIDRRKRLLWFLVIILILLLFLMWLWFGLFRKQPPAPAPQPVKEEVVTTLPPSEPEVSPIAQQQRDDRIASASLNVLGKTFTEPYGSYSNDANFQNLRDVLPLM